MLRGFEIGREQVTPLNDIKNLTAPLESFPAFAASLPSMHSARTKPIAMSDPSFIVVSVLILVFG